MNFEYDPNKSESNKAKHGIDFDEAKKLWESLTVTIPLGSGHGEERQAVFGIIDSKHWTTITTYRGKNIRIISVRRSRKDEVDLYECKKRNQR